MPIKLRDFISPYPYKQTALALISAKSIFEAFLNWRQYRKLSKTSSLPDELKDMKITDEEFLNARQFTRKLVKYELLLGLATFALYWVMLHFDYFPKVWEYCGSFLKYWNLDPNNDYFRATAFMIIEVMREKVVALPFLCYKNFRIEQLYKKNFIAFLAEEVISLITRVSIIVVLLNVILWALYLGGQRAHVYAGMALILAYSLVKCVYPKFVSPMLNKFYELEDGPLRQEIIKLSERAKFPLRNIYYVDSFTRSEHSECYFFGFGNRINLVLFDTLIHQLNNDEALACISHQMAHWKGNHNFKLAMLTFIEILALVYLYGIISNNDLLAYSFGFSQNSAFIGLFLFSIYLSPLSFIFDLCAILLQRKFEFTADAYSLALGQVKGLESAIKKVSHDNLGEVDSDHLYAAFTHSYPTLLDRIRNLKKLEAKHR